MRKFFGILLILGGALGAWAAISHFLWQHRAVHQFVPVEAQVLDAHVQVNRGKSTSYTPKATYRYTYNGHPYESTRVLPVDESGSSRWAEGIVSGLRAQQMQPIVRGANAAKTVAYINPDRPEESVLVRAYSFSPYGLAMLALLVTTIGVGLWLNTLGGGRDTMAAIALDDSGWQLLLPTKSLRTRFWDSVSWLVGAAVAAVPLLHWFLVAEQVGTGGIVWGTVALAVLVILLLMMLRRWSLSRHISDARVRVKPVPMKRGEVFSMEVEADAFSMLDVKEMRGQVLCIEHYQEKRGNKTQVGSRTKGEQSLVLVGEVTVPPGQVVEGKGELFFGDSGLPPTTDLTVKLYPHYKWEIRISVKLRGMVDYNGVFPLEVE